MTDAPEEPSSPVSAFWQSIDKAYYEQGGGLKNVGDLFSRRIPEDNPGFVVYLCRACNQTLTFSVFQETQVEAPEAVVKHFKRHKDERNTRSR